MDQIHEESNKSKPKDIVRYNFQPISIRIVCATDPTVKTDICFSGARIDNRQEKEKYAEIKRRIRRLQKPEPIRHRPSRFLPSWKEPTVVTVTPDLIPTHNACGCLKTPCLSRRCSTLSTGWQPSKVTILGRARIKIRSISLPRLHININVIDLVIDKIDKCSINRRVARPTAIGVPRPSFVRAGNSRPARAEPSAASPSFRAVARSTPIRSQPYPRFP